MWTIEALDAEVDYRLNGTRDRTSRLHLHEVKRTAPAWVTRLLHRNGSRTHARSTG